MTGTWIGTVLMIIGQAWVNGTSLDRPPGYHGRVGPKGLLGCSLTLPVFEEAGSCRTRDPVLEAVRLES